MYNIIAPKRIIDQFKRSKWFKVNLGRNVSLRDKDQTRFEINPEDVFVKFYFEKYKVLIQSEGMIGTINFFSDYYINGDIVVIYYKSKEFIFQHEAERINKNGVDDYIGSIIKEIVTKYQEELDVVDDIETDNKIDPEKVVNNPGAVTWDDIVAMKKKQGLL